MPLHSWVCTVYASDALESVPRSSFPLLQKATATSAAAHVYCACELYGLDYFRQFLRGQGVEWNAGIESAEVRKV